MKLELELNKNDHLQYQLYAASKKRSVKTQKMRNRIIVTGGVFLIGAGLYISTDSIYFIVSSCVVSLFIFLLYPFYLRRLYVKHFSKYIDETCKNSIGKKVALEISDGFMISKTSESESELKVDIKEIKDVVEIATNYFIKFDDAAAFVLPKNSETKMFVETFAKDYNKKIIDELNWKWK